MHEVHENISIVLQYFWVYLRATNALTSRVDTRAGHPPLMTSQP